MNITVYEVSVAEYTQMCADYLHALPIWALPKYLDCYRNKLLLVAKEADHLRGIWIVPLTVSDQETFAKRQFRFFPYSSPVILEKDNLTRRHVTRAFFQFVLKRCHSLSLPMDPNFKDLPTVQGLGAFTEWRHTHIVSAPLSFSTLQPRLRNHINHAKKHVSVHIDTDPTHFNAELAIKNGGDERAQRAVLAEKLLQNENAVLVYAQAGEKITGGLFIAYDHERAYLMHSWQVDQIERGTISYLISEAIAWTFQTKKLAYFDFEGSVIQSIDYFFTGFDADITPYAYVHWSEKKEDLFAIIDRSIHIPGRISEI